MYDEHFIVSSKEFTPKKRTELNKLLSLYDEYQELIDAEKANPKYNKVADTSKYNLFYYFFGQFNNYFNKVPEI